MRAIDIDFLNKYKTENRKFGTIVLKEKFVRVLGSGTEALILQLFIDKGYMDNWIRIPIALVKLSGILPEMTGIQIAYRLKALREKGFLKRKRLAGYGTKNVYEYRVDVNNILRKRLLNKEDLYG